MQNNEAIERTARAMALSDGLNTAMQDMMTFDDDFINEVPRWTLYIRQARTAIAAFLEDVPVSEGMKLDAVDAWHDSPGDFESEYIAAFKAMCAKLAEELRDGR